MRNRNKGNWALILVVHGQFRGAIDQCLSFDDCMKLHEWYATRHETNIVNYFSIEC